jgi:hypothetical protein
VSVDADAIPANATAKATTAVAAMMIEAPRQFLLLFIPGDLLIVLV